MTAVTLVLEHPDLIVRCLRDAASRDDINAAPLRGIADQIADQTVERWWESLTDAIDTYTNLLREYNDAGKADRERFLKQRVQDAKRAVIDEFYASGWFK